MSLSEPASESVALADGERLAVLHDVAEGDADALRLPDPLKLEVRDREAREDCDTDPVVDIVGDTLALPLSDADAQGDAESVTDAESVSVACAEGEADVDDEGGGGCVGVPVLSGDGDVVSELLGEVDTDSVTDGDSEPLGDADADGGAVPVAESPLEGVAVAVWESDVLAHADSDGDDETVKLADAL